VGGSLGPRSLLGCKEEWRKRKNGASGQRERQGLLRADERRRERTKEMRGRNQGTGGGNCPTPIPKHPRGCRDLEESLQLEDGEEELEQNRRTKRRRMAKRGKERLLTRTGESSLYADWTKKAKKDGINQEKNNWTPERRREETRQGVREGALELGDEGGTSVDEKDDER